MPSRPSAPLPPFWPIPPSPPLTSMYKVPFEDQLEEFNLKLPPGLPGFPGIPSSPSLPGSVPSFAFALESLISVFTI